MGSKLLMYVIAAVLWCIVGANACATCVGNVTVDTDGATSQNQPAAGDVILNCD